MERWAVIIQQVKNYLQDGVNIGVVIVATA